MGEQDYVFKFPGMEDYIRSGKVKDFVPDLEIVYLPEGTHFVHEQLPDQVNQLILTFLNKHVWVTRVPWRIYQITEAYVRSLKYIWMWLE